MALLEELFGIFTLFLSSNRNLYAKKNVFEVLKILICIYYNFFCLRSADETSPEDFEYTKPLTEGQNPNIFAFK